MCSVASCTPPSFLSGAELQAEVEWVSEGNKTRPLGIAWLLPVQQATRVQVLRRGEKKRRHRGTPADLPSYFYFILQLLCPSTRWDPRNPQTERRKGIIMAKIAGISQLQGEEEAGFTRLMGCQWVRCWENRTGTDKLAKCKMAQEQRDRENEMVPSEMTASIKFVVEN